MEFWTKVKTENEFYKTLNKYLIDGTRSRIQSRLQNFERPHAG